MFEFGRDLRKLFAQARESEDLSWLELIGANLVEAEARAQSVDAGRVSCRKPMDAALRAAALWREQARRSGRRIGLDKALSSAEDAARRAVGADAQARTTIERVRILLLDFDLFGRPGALAEAAALIEATQTPARDLGAQLAAVHARLAARRQRMSGDVAGLMDAAALMDAAVHDSQTSLPRDQVEDLQLDRAALLLEGGMVQRDARLLDQAGRELSLLVEAASPDYRPLTRARALVLCAAGLAGLAALAHDDAAAAQARVLFDAAAEQFTPDHSPLDWAAIQIARAGDPQASLKGLMEAEALAAEPGSILGALARERRLALQVEAAEAAGDRAMLDAMSDQMKRRLSVGQTPVDWAADQIGLVRVGLARQALGGPEMMGVGLVLIEAADAARDWGAPALADRALMLLPNPQTV